MPVLRGMAVPSQLLAPSAQVEGSGVLVVFAMTFVTSHGLLMSGVVHTADRYELSVGETHAGRDPESSRS